MRLTESSCSNVFFIGNQSIIDSDKYQIASVEDCLDYFKDKDSIQVDTETEGKDPHSKRILSLQIGDSNRQYVIDTRVIPIKNFKSLLESKLTILHNSKFDYKFLKSSGIILDKIYDTMLAECVLYCGYEKYGYGLKDLCFRYLDVNMSKDVRGEFYKVKDQPLTTEQILYAAKDVQHLHTIREMQLKKIKALNLNYCLDLENEVVKALADIEYNGMYLNREKWMSNTNTYKEKLEELTKELDLIVLAESKLKPFIPQTIQGNLFGFEQRNLDINYASPLQIKKICLALGFDIDSTDDRNLQKLVHQHEFFKKLQDYREVSKIISTYGEGFLNYINKNTNRVHTSFWQVLKVLGTYSSNTIKNKWDKLQETHNFLNLYNTNIVI